MATSSVGFDNFFSTTLNGAISDSDLTITLNAVPTPSEGFLVIEPDNASKREILYYTSKGASTVTCPSGAGNGRGYDGTTATSHADGATVVMAPVAAMFEALQDMSAIADGTVDTALIADGAVTNAKLNTTMGELGGSWDTWTYNDTGIGSNVTVTGNYTQIGKTVHGWILFTLTGTPSSMSNIGFDLPVTMAAGAVMLGTALAKDSGSLTYVFNLQATSTTVGQIRLINDSVGAGSNNLSLGTATLTDPFTWASGDTISASFTYEAA